MCKVLGISRSSYYTYKETTPQQDILCKKIVEIFYKSKQIYGTRKIKIELQKLGYVVSRRKISRIMKLNGLVSVYTVKNYKVHKDQTNHENMPDLVNRKFAGRKRYEVVVSDFTYVRVGDQWHYICILLDLYNREIIGYSCSKHKNAQLVYDAIATIKTNLKNLQIFHTDRGSEFKNYKIDKLLQLFQIKRSLSSKGCPYDNAVAEAQFKIIKTEFVRSRRFQNIEHLKAELAAYVYWFNHKRIHSALNYKTPVEAR